MTTKKDVDLAQINATKEKTEAFVSFAGVVVRVIGWVVAIKFIMTGLENIVLSKPESISALAKVVDALNLGSITGYVLALGAGVAWKQERNGKKRAIKKFSNLKNKYEPGETSSGLTETGDSPDEE